MSGTGFVAATDASGLRPLGTAAVSAYHRHGQLTTILRARGDDDLADLFTEPVYDDDVEAIDWYTPLPGRSTPLAALPVTEQEAALVILGRQIARLEALREALQTSGNADERNLSNLLEIARVIPGRDFIYVVDGAPVLVCWGFQYDRPEPNRLDLTVYAPQRVVAAPLRPAAWRRWWRALAALLILLLLLIGWRSVDWSWALADPVLRPDAAETFSGESINIPVLDNDDGVMSVAFSLAVQSDPAAGQAEVLPDGRIHYRAPPGHGERQFTYSVDTLLHGRRFATVTVRIPNRPPVAVDDTVSVSPGATADLDVLTNDFDPDGDPLALVEIGAPTGGVARITPQGRIEFRPNPGFRGVARLGYKIGDGAGGTAGGTLTVRVENRPPVPATDAARVVSGQAVVIPVLANDTDPDSDPLKTVSVSSAGHGVTTLLPDGQVRYEPALGYRGDDAFRYVVTDGYGGKAEGEVRVSVVPDCRPLPPSTSPGSLALVVDLTGSMVKDNRIQRAREALESFIPAIPPTVGMALVAFRDCNDIMQTPILGAEHRAELLAMVRAMQANGPEDALAPSMRRAGDLLRTVASNPVKMIVLTDGGNSCGDARQVARDLKAEMAGLEIHVVALGDPNSIYRDIADAGGGRVWLPHEGGSLATTLRQVSRQELPAECGR